MNAEKISKYLKDNFIPYLIMVIFSWVILIIFGSLNIYTAISSMFLGILVYTLLKKIGVKKNDKKI